jgi:hypothetical protein
MLAPVRDLPRPVVEIMSFQHERLLSRHRADCGVSRQVAERRLHGLKQFLTVCGATPGAKVTSAPIDEMWHSFLLFTNDYRAYA